MIQRIRNSGISKIVSLFMVVNFAMEFLSPLRVLALTGGPTQPEMSGFTPVDGDNMVDLFSGDFHHTIPLMSVPGPNGAYPVNLNYNSGPGMEQEASWVGLGWNLNPGAITREVRGIPDDFRGDEITKLHTQRDNNTFVFTHGGAGEISGIDPDIGFSMSRSFTYNTYAGISLHRRYGISGGYTRQSTIERGTEKPADTLKQKVSVSLNLDLSSDNGLSPSFGISGKRNNLAYGATFGFNSKSGSYAFNTGVSLAYSPSAGLSYSNASCLPAFPVRFHTRSYGAGFKVGGEAAFLEGTYNISASVSIQSAPFIPESKGSYGLLHMENATEEHLQDLNREKEMGVTQNSLNLPLPVMTHDIYAVNGELMRGSFRAYRSDVGYFTDTRVTTSTSIVDMDLEAATAGGFQFGGGGNMGTTSSHTGGWDHGTYPGEIGFKDKRQYSSVPSPLQSIDPVLYEPFYFKMSGEQTANEKDYIDYLDKEKPLSFPLFFRSVFLSFKSSKDYHAASPLRGNPVRSNREKRTSNIEYEFGGDTRAGRKAHHVSEFTISDAEGTRFRYGKTLYNQKEREVFFSLERSGSLGLHSTVCADYQTGWASPETRNRDRVGKEKLYTSTEMPPYAYSYLLTSITGYDYVDLDGVVGPSAGDAGHWVKFGYNEPYGDYYRWRIPYEGANFIAGEVSNKQDDKGSYTYGEKEIAYLEIIETQTHYARFYTSPRQDALEVGPNDEHIYKGGSYRTSKSLHKLDSIRLYSKMDTGRPLQTVIFEYDYSLCGNIPNHRSHGQGKLTLTKVYITHGNSQKGMDNPYVFDYHEYNPTYDATLMDRWGNYKGDASYFDHYVSQSDPGDWPAAWSLKRITLPSGGSIEVEYEGDDYAYVQDKQAMYMETITKREFEEEGGKYYVSFKTDPAEDPKDYVKGFKNELMYFKIAVRSNVGGTDYPDYISGYVRINPGNVVSSADRREAKVEVLPYSIYARKHPFVVICYQYLKDKRPDLLFGLNDIDDNTSDIKSFFKAMISGGKTAMASAMFGDKSFYRYCSQQRYFPAWETQDRHLTSYVRLNKVDKIKCGGGHRVKEIRVSGHWTGSGADTYTREYYYRIMEGGKLISSGVAENEPAVCGEENCMRYAVYNQVKGLFYKQDDTYSEMPYGESYFPGARVGYSQVVTRTRVPDDVTLAAPGIQVSRFYTAKDFPVKVEQTHLDAQTDRPNLLSVLGSGFKQAKTSGYSQGYSIQLNDMHGKQKSVATYPFQELPPGDEAARLAVLAEASGYVSKVEYKYKTKINGRALELDNEVEVLLGDNISRKMKLGETYDFIVDLRQNRSSGNYFGLQANTITPVYTPPIPVPVVTPSIDAHEEIVRSVATTKVIYKTGILEEVVAYNKGSKITTRNLQWDPYTGQPLSTSHNNEFEKPVYTYNMPAYWHHDNMGSAAENYRAFYSSSFGNKDAVLLSAVKKYDRVYMPSGEELTTEVVFSYTGSGLLRGWNSGGNSSTVLRSGNSLEVVRSRMSNQLSAMGSTLVSLEPPADARRFPLFETFNKQDDSCFYYTDCFGDSIPVKASYYQGRFYFFVANEYHPPQGGAAMPNCSLYIPSIIRQSRPHALTGVLPSGMPSRRPTDYHFIKHGDKVEIVTRNSPRRSYWLSWTDSTAAFPECMDGVLQASATEYVPQWKTRYTDAALPSVSASKEEYLRMPNIHRPLRSNHYVEERKQHGNSGHQTNIAYDGTFNGFVFFSHASGSKNFITADSSALRPWRWGAEITQYNVRGFEIENVLSYRQGPHPDLDIYSAALYAHGNSLPVAVANNARYREIGFDGFEQDPDIPVTGSPYTRGHLRYEAGSVTSEKSHTGNFSLRNNNQIRISAAVAGTAPTAGLCLQPGKEYVFSCWVCDSKTGTPLLFSNGDFTVAVDWEEPVEGWQRVECRFTVPSTATNVTLLLWTLDRMLRPLYFDDIRVMPAEASMKTYVYDRFNYRLLSELDENNHALFYNYDEEGVLVQVKKETERGIRTLQTTRRFLRKYVP